MRISAWRLFAYAMIILAGVATALPNLFTPQQLSALPDWLPKQQVALGLDLRGGAHLVLEVDAKALIGERVQDVLRETRRVLRAAKVDPVSVRRDGDAVVVTLADGVVRSQASLALKNLSGAGQAALGQTGEIEVANTGASELRVTLTQAGIRARECGGGAEPRNSAPAYR